MCNCYNECRLYDHVCAFIFLTFALANLLSNVSSVKKLFALGEGNYYFKVTCPIITAYITK